MNYALVTVSRGIIEDARFFDDPSVTIRALSDYVKSNKQHDIKFKIFNCRNLLI